MKALTNILNYILLLLMILIASCTEDTAEVDNLVQGEEYVTVRMQVPGMKNATTRADEAEDNLSSVVVLVFRNDALVSKTEVTTASSTLTTTSTTGTFNIPRPKSEDVIHFLGNLPETVKNSLPATGGTQEDVLRGLTTSDDKNLSYWGKTNYTGGDVIDNVTLYRNMAKIEIAPDPNECTFPEDQLFIVGLFKANQSGALVPYNGSFNFDLTTNDYFTLPADVEKETDGDAQPVTSLYVFEHDNPDAYTEANKDNFFCVICQIGKDYYKVALTSDGKKPYDIIRNHKYTILVKDLDEGAADYPTALTADPINLEIKVEKEVALQLIQEGIDENGNELEIQQGDIDINSHANSTEEVTIKVVVPAGVKTLTVKADGFTVTSGDAGDDREMTSDGNNQYTIKEAYRNQENIVRFKLKLNNDVDAETETTITVSGEGEDQYTTITATSTTITVTPTSETEGTIWWQGLMVLDAMDDETKIAIPKSYFFSGETPLLPVGSQIVFDFENVTGFLSNTDDDYRKIWMQAADPRDWSQVASQDFVYDGNRATLNVTQEVLDDILDTSDGEYANDNALIIQGQGRILKKITLIRAIIATPDKTQLYYDSDDTQVVTINVTVPDGVETLNIGGAGNFTVTQSGNPLTDSYTVTDNSNPIPFVFTLKPNVTEKQTITFSDPSESVNGDEVQITMAPTPMVTFSPDESSKEMSINDTYTITMIVPINDANNDELTALSIEAEGFTVASSSDGLTGPTNNVYSYAGGTTTFTFTPTSADSKTIRFYDGEGVDINVPEKEISVTVKAAAVSNMSVSPTNAIIDMDNSQTYTTLTLTKPASVQSVKVNISAENAFNITTGATTNSWAPSTTEYYFYSLTSEEATFTLTMRDGFSTAGDYTVTFMNNDNQSMSATATIKVKKTPTVSFLNTGKQTLYWNNGSPTSFDVEMTGVPIDGSVTLSINAAAFTVTKSSESSGTLSGPSNGVYTYTGGNTTFTITPASAESITTTTPHTITIADADANDGVNVPNTPIIVTVGETAPSEVVIWPTTSDSSPINVNNGYTLYNQNNLGTPNYYVVGATVKVYFKYNYTYDWQMSQLYLRLKTNSSKIFAEKNYEEGKTNDVLEYIIQEDDLKVSENGWADNMYYANLVLQGSYVTITKISIIPAR